MSGPVLDPIDPPDPPELPDSGVGPPDVRSVGFAGADGIPPRKRWGRRLRAVIGVVLIAVGAVGFGWGLWTTIAAGRALGDDAVARGTVAPQGTQPETVSFVARRAETHTIWVANGGTNDEQRDDLIDAVACAVRTSDGAVAEVRGSQQGSTVTIGDRSTVGTFTTAEGRVEVACAQPTGSSRAAGRLYLVVPGSPRAAGLAIGAMVAGVFAVVGGAILLGARRRAR